MNDFQSVYTFIREYLKNGSNEERLKNDITEQYKYYLQILTQGMSKQDTKLVREETEKYEYIKSIYEKYLKTETEAMNIAYAIGIAIGESNVGKTWLKEQTDENRFEQNMSILLSKAHIKDIIVTIYRNPGIQHKTLAGQADIKANYLNQLASQLEQVRCVRRYGTGKCTYYELTIKGREYVRKIVGLQHETVRKQNFLEDVFRFDKIYDTKGESDSNKSEKRFDEEYDYKYLRDDINTNKRKNAKILEFSQYMKGKELLEK